ncbi:MAG: AI-2E family transporter [Silvanigrellaceae bacterium]|nr:AI-2E family transporter [Silvanigrellaceae bacterium]
MIKQAKYRRHLFFFLVGIFCCFILSPLFFPIFMGIIAAYVSEDIINFFLRYFNKSSETWRYVFALLFIIFLCVIFAGPISLFISMSVNDLTQLLHNSDMKYSQFGLRNEVVHAIKKITDQIGLLYTIDEIFVKVVELSQDLSKSILLFISNAIFETPKAILQFIIFVLTWIIFIVHGENFRKRILPIVIPWQAERIMVSRTMGNTLKALIVANLFVSITQCFVITVTLGLAGIPKFAVWGLFSFFFSFIPIIGTAPITLGVAAWCYFVAHKSVTAIIILCIGLFVGIIDNVLRPIFMKGGVNLNFFWIFLSIIGGIYQLGFIGVIVGPVSFSLFVTLVKEIEKNFSNQIVKIEPESSSLSEDKTE